MADQLGLVVLVIALVAAFIGGMIARYMRLPVILGYIVAGIIIGPHGLHFVTDTAQIETIAEIGVALLVFAIGMEVSLKTLRKMGLKTAIGSMSQVLVTMLLGMCIGLVLGWSMLESVIFGFIIAFSSTTIMLKVLMDRGELDTTHGRIMLGFNMIQDLWIIPIMVILPVLKGGDWTEALGIAALKAALFLGALFLVGLWILPRVLKRVAAVRSRELFLLAIFGLCITIAFLSDYFGLSIVLGAFVAGVIISESDYAYQAIADVIPLRDIFATVFFVSLGMLIDFRFFADNVAQVLIVVMIIIIGKFIICALVPRVMGYSIKTSLFTGSGMFQMSEFGFVLAAAAMSVGVITKTVYDLVLPVAAITLLLAPFGMGTMSRIYRKLNQNERISKVLARRTDPQYVKGFQLTNHVVICGGGSVVKILVSVLEKRGFTRLVINDDPRMIDELRGRGVPCIYGDASNPDILARAVLEKAKVMVITIPDTIFTELTVKNAHAINPKLDIVARVQFDEHAGALREMGVAEVVRPEFEAGLEMVRHTLHRYGLTGSEIQYILNILREGGPEEK